MRIIVNGEPRDYELRLCCLKDLLRDMGASAGRVAVLVNDEIVASGKHESFELQEADRVEILVLAGGG